MDQGAVAGPSIRAGRPLAAAGAAVQGTRRARRRGGEAVGGGETALAGLVRRVPVQS